MIGLIFLFISLTRFFVKASIYTIWYFIKISFWLIRMAALATVAIITGIVTLVRANNQRRAQRPTPPIKSPRPAASRRAAVPRAATASFSLARPTFEPPREAHAAPTTQPSLAYAAPSPVAEPAPLPGLAPAPYVPPTPRMPTQAQLKAPARSKLLGILAVIFAGTGAALELVGVLTNLPSVTGIAILLLSFPGAILAIIAIVFAGVGRRWSRGTPTNSLANFGLVTGICALAGPIVIFVGSAIISGIIEGTAS